MDEQRAPSSDQGGKTRRTEPGAGWGPSCHSVGRAEKGETRESSRDSHC